MTACAKCGFDEAVVVLASWTLTFSRAVLSGNARVHNVGASRWRYKKDRDGWLADLEVLRRVHAVTPAATKRRATLTRVIGHRQRPYDHDNLRTGCKPIVDALVSAGLLVGDRPQDAEIHYSQIKTGRVPGLVLLLEELEQPPAPPPPPRKTKKTR